MMNNILKTVSEEHYVYVSSLGVPVISNDGKLPEDLVNKAGIRLFYSGSHKSTLVREVLDMKEAREEVFGELDFGKITELRDGLLAWEQGEQRLGVLWLPTYECFIVDYNQGDIYIDNYEEDGGTYVIPGQLELDFDN